MLSPGAPVSQQRQSRTRGLKTRITGRSRELPQARPPSLQVGQRSGNSTDTPHCRASGAPDRVGPGGSPQHARGSPHPHGRCPETRYLGKVKVLQHRALYARHQRHGEPQQGREHSALHVWLDGQRGPAPQSHRIHGLGARPWAYMPPRGHWGGAWTGLTEQVGSMWQTSWQPPTHKTGQPEGEAPHWVPSAGQCPFACSAAVAPGPGPPREKPPRVLRLHAPVAGGQCPASRMKKQDRKGVTCGDTLTLEGNLIPGLIHPWKALWECTRV